MFPDTTVLSPHVRHVGKHFVVSPLFASQSTSSALQQIAGNVSSSGFLSGFLFGFRVLFLYQHVTILVQKLKKWICTSTVTCWYKTDPEIQKEILTENQKTTRFPQSAILPRELGKGFFSVCTTSVWGLQNQQIIRQNNKSYSFVRSSNPAFVRSKYNEKQKFIRQNNIKSRNSIVEIPW